VEVFQVRAGTLDQDESRKIAYHIRQKRGVLLFARCWLLVEGETEFTLIPELARALGLDLDLLGVSCVEFSQCGLRPLIKVARDLGIEWHLLTDGDAQGQRYEATAQALLGSDVAAERITKLADVDVEHTLWHGGYQATFEQAVDAQHRFMVVAAPGSAEYADQTISAAIKSTSKPYLAYLVGSQIAQPNSPGVPSSLLFVTQKAVALAGKSA